MASLWVTSGSLAGQSVGVTGELVVGRENADLTVDDAEVSRRHVAVRLAGGQLEIEDLGSANGTFVDGSRIDGPVKVGGGSKIRIGQTEFEVRGVLPATADKPAPTAADASPIADPQATRATPIADPQTTKPRAIPEPQVTKAAPIADPQVTRARAIPEPQVTKAAPIADPQTTKPRAIPEPQVTEAAPIADPQTTKPHTVSDPQVTHARSRPADVAKPQPSSESVLDTSPPIPRAPAAPAPGSSKNVAAQVGAFSPPARRRSRGLASRSWVPTVASFGTAFAAAAALIVYFAEHGIPS
ncbi:MAG TPA: FHA domain-containing protein [Solirubrobacteraceae bacterium]|nr:FHA domain-containing protein [Solirubrobacteraceae bacterium]